MPDSNFPRIVVEEEDPRKRLYVPVRSMQINLAILSIGIVVFVVFVVEQGRIDFEDFSVRGLVSSCCLVFGLLGLVLSRVVPRFIAPRTSGEDDDDAETNLKQRREAYLETLNTRLLVGARISEAAAFVNLIAVLWDRSTPNFLMAVVLLAANLMMFPTVDSVAAKIEEFDRFAEEKRRWQ